MPGNEVREVCAAYLLRRAGRPYWQELWVLVATGTRGPYVDGVELFAVHSRPATIAEQQAMDSRLDRLTQGLDHPGLPFLTTWALVSTSQPLDAAYFIRYCASGSLCEEVNPDQAV